MLFAQVSQHAVQYRAHLAGMLDEMVFLHHLDVGDRRARRWEWAVYVRPLWKTRSLKAAAISVSLPPLQGA
jgi:hypothetical protein